ncbi:protein SFI1 homolog [Nematolebias whitei]|uniref:protein SFI1 homolog n=1 Tax=Nematolebias whitei TaxID=451745 RepID=UPI00189B5DDE|nr:protein SFI1 homolog [Nematolebias whitei]
MQSNFVRKSDSASKPRIRSSDSESKQLKVQTRKIPYRVGYNWNKGGRLKELRIRHLARKFLKLWMHRTFGRVLPQEARVHYTWTVLRRAFEGWRDEWWTSRREWSLTMRADCHYRYYLCTRTLHRWRAFISLQREKNTKLQEAQLLADRRLMRLVWDKWKVFIEMKRMHRRMLGSALEHKRLSMINSAWNLWQTRLQQQQQLHIFEDQALKQRALKLQSKAWLVWKEMYRTACHERENESKAALHFIVRQKKQLFCQWICYVSHRKTKKTAQAAAQHACSLHLGRNCWSKWRNALNQRLTEEICLQAASHLAVRSTQRRALERWKAYVKLCRENAERNQTACQHFHNRLLHAGLQGFSLNVVQNRARRLNNNMAVQHHQQTMMSKYWKQWKERLEEAEDQSFQPLSGMAQTNYRISLLRSCFHLWREKLAQQRCMQDMELRADVWFADCKLPQYFKSWLEFTLQRQLQEQRRRKAEAFNCQRQYSWVFYTWWGQSEKHKEEMLSEQMAVLHEERRHLRRAWIQWRQHTRQRIEEAQKQEASRCLYVHRLLHKTVTQWKKNTTEIQDRRRRELQACHRGDLCCMRSAVDKWKKFVQEQREKKIRLTKIQSCHEVKLLKLSFTAWKVQHIQMTQMNEQAEECYRQKTQRFLRKVFTRWRQKAALLVEVQMAEQQAQNHFQRFLQLKVFVGWREATTRAVSKRHQQGAALSRLQRTINQICLLRSFRCWRKHTREARRQRINMEKARRHHCCTLVSKTLKVWRKYHHQHQRKRVMKRQGVVLLRLKMYQKYFELWKLKLQHRRREAHQTERALWLWSLTLQAKVLSGWRLWAAEQRSKREQASRAAQVYRDRLLREGVSCILTYAAHMSDLTTSLTQFSQEQRSQRLQRVVKRCALRWKQRALCRRRKEQEVGQLKKSVTFCLTEPALGSISSSGSEEQRDDAPSRHTKYEPDPACSEAALNPFEFSCPSHQDPAPSSLLISTVILSGPQRSIAVSPLELENQDVLLPPAAFMTPKTQRTVSTLIQPPSAFTDSNLRAIRRPSKDPREENESYSAESALTQELLSIQRDMKSFQQSRKQLRAWRKLREVLQSWLQTSAEEEQMEKTAVCEELKELEERINRLSAELEKLKPTMLLHTERIQHLQSVLHTSDVHPPCSKSTDKETSSCVFAI